MSLTNPHVLLAVVLRLDNIVHDFDGLLCHNIAETHAGLLIHEAQIEDSVERIDELDGRLSPIGTMELSCFEEVAVGPVVGDGELQTIFSVYPILESTNMQEKSAL